MSDNTFYKLTVDKDTSLQEIISSNIKSGVSESDIMDFQDNKARIYKLYNDDEKKKFSEADAGLIKASTELLIPYEYYTRMLKSTNAKDKWYCKPDLLKEPYWNEVAQKYLDGKIDKTEFYDGINKQFYAKVFNRVYVKIYSRAMEEVINVSAYIIDSSFGVSGSGGNFNFSLQPIECEFEKKSKKWKKMDIPFLDQFYSKSNVYRLDESGNRKRCDLYFDKVLNSQDLVFIKLDEPFLEETIDVSTLDEYDMIGLIDAVNAPWSQTEDSINMSVEVRGRDLIKVFMEDGTYFYPVEMVSGQTVAITEIKRYGQDTLEEGTGFPVRILGKLNDMQINMDLPLKNLFGWIVDKLKIVTLDLKNTNGCFRNFDEKLGIWNFIEFSMEDSEDTGAGNRVIKEQSISTMQGSIINFMKTIIAEPFVEMVFDTIGNKYCCQVRTTPLTEKLVRNNHRLVISDQYIDCDDTYTTDQDFYSWFLLQANSVDLSNRFLPMLFLPAIMIEKFSKIYGSKKYHQIHNYLYYKVDDFTPKKRAEELIDSQFQASLDLKFITEAFSMNPFLRQGTITCKNIKGIKRGINIYIPETDMLYYVEGYKHTSDIKERKTVIDVTRGIPLKALSLFYSLVKVQMEERKITGVTLDEKVLKQLYMKYYEDME